MADFLATPRVGGLARAADGSRLAVSVATLDAEKKKWQSALWEVDPAGAAAARRLTRSAPGEAAPALAPRGPPAVPPPPPVPGREGGRRPQAGAVEPSGRRRRGPPR